MRVLMTTDAVGGVWTYASELRDALREQGAEVVLVAVGPRPAPDPEVEHVPCRLEWQPDPWEDVEASGRRLLEIAREVRPDVVHLNQFAYGALDWPCPSLVVGHSDVLSWHEAVRGEPAGPEWDAYRAEVGRGLQAADAVVAPSAAMLAALRRHYDLADGGEVIHNGTTGSDLLVPRGRLVLAAGRMWDPAKGLDAVDAAAARSPWPVEVAGDAEGAGARHARLLGILPRDELRERMARAAIFAHPARYEPFGLAPLEAAAAGCALILGDIPSLRELWDGAARFVAAGDGDALGAAIARLAADDDERERLAASARERAAERTAARMAEAYTQLYARLAGRVVAA